MPGAPRWCRGSQVCGCIGIGLDVRAQRLVDAAKRLTGQLDDPSRIGGDHLGGCQSLVFGAASSPRAPTPAGSIDSTTIKSTKQKDNHASGGPKSESAALSFGIGRRCQAMLFASGGDGMPDHTNYGDFPISPRYHNTIYDRFSYGTGAPASNAHRPETKQFQHPPIPRPAEIFPREPRRTPALPMRPARTMSSRSEISGCRGCRRCRAPTALRPRPTQAGAFD